MNNHITVTNLTNQTTWSGTISEVILKEAKEKRSHNGRLVMVIPAVLYPVRTNNLKNFAKDFFLPTVINQALRVNHAVGKYFALFFATLLDLATFPVRLVTAAPRWVNNPAKQQSPFYQFLKKQQVDPKLLEGESVKVRLIWEQTSIFNCTQWTDSTGEKHIRYNKETHWEEQYVHFCDLPYASRLDGFKSGSH